MHCRDNTSYHTWSYTGKGSTDGTFGRLASAGNDGGVFVAMGMLVHPVRWLATIRVEFSRGNPDMDHHQMPMLMNVEVVTM